MNYIEFDYKYDNLKCIRVKHNFNELVIINNNCIIFYENNNHAYLIDKMANLNIYRKEEGEENE